MDNNEFDNVMSGIGDEAPDAVFGKHDMKENIENVSPAVIKRLPRYHRFLRELLKCGKLRISSTELSKLMGVTASQIRQDLNCFGGFGQQGYGYNVKYLYGKLNELLGAEEAYGAIIVGSGNLGRALASSHMFENRGVMRLAMFDVDENVVGSEISGLTVYHTDMLDEYCRSHHVDIAVITTPLEAAEPLARTLEAAGVRGIWNFANVELKAQGEGTSVMNMCMGDALMTLCYEIKEKENSGR